MAAEKILGGLLHCTKIERICHRVHEPALKNIRAPAVPDTVDIGLAHARKPCVEDQSIKGKREVCSGKAADLLLQLGGDVVNYKNGPFADG